MQISSVHVPKVSGLQFNGSFITLVALIAVPILGLLLGDNRLRRMTLAIFVGLVLAQTFAHTVFTWLEHFNPHYITEPHVALAIFILTVVLLNLGPLSKNTSHRFSIHVLILSLLASCLLISNILIFLPPEVRLKLVHDSAVIAFLNQTRLIWMAASVVWLIILQLWPQKDVKKHH